MATCEKCPDQTGCQEGDCVCECHEPKRPPHLTRSLISGTGAVFVALKLFHVIAWSWWWVLSPMLFGMGVSLLAGILIGIGEVRSRKG
jgi:hypothetical protein